MTGTKSISSSPLCQDGLVAEHTDAERAAWFALELRANIAGETFDELRGKL
jgi:hypothetical protein